MSFFSTLFGMKPKIETKTVVDPLKTAVASPLSSYLSSQIGQGVPRYTGELTAPAVSDPGLAYGGGGALSDFLKLNANDFFNTKVQDPTIAAWKKDVQPVVREGWAGALSGSGRYSEESSSGSDLMLGLAQKRGDFELALPQTQYGITSQMRNQDFQIASQIKAQKDEALKLEYNDWMKSLPHYNPVLDKALSFLSNSSGTGTDVLSALNPGTTGIFADIMKALGTLGAASISAGAGTAVPTK